MTNVNVNNFIMNKEKKKKHFIIPPVPDNFSLEEYTTSELVVIDTGFESMDI